MNPTQLETYLTEGVENLISNAIKATLTNPRESAFLGKFALRARRSAEIRRRAEAVGTHIPPFLIASITNACNLHCIGCYARENDICYDGPAVGQMSASEWSRVFREAEGLGVDFVLLAGGEPLLRRDVIEQAASCEMLFPIFTNGTLLDQEYLGYLNRHRNLMPVLSIEGDLGHTDSRRGEGIYDHVSSVMDLLDGKGILFGASVTVTKENIHEVTSDAFVDGLREKGCRLLLYVEYVPVDPATRDLAPAEAERTYLAQQTRRLRSRSNVSPMLLISFPGDERESGGCLAAGRGFFHIDPSGKAEPCPFSPYSDTDLRSASLLDALRSPLFAGLREGVCLEGEHIGGCTLFEQAENVRHMAGVL